MALKEGLDDPRLDVSYKYPFLKDAKELMLRLNQGFDPRLMEQGRLRLEEALSEKGIGFQKVNINSVKYAYLMSYVYARMLVSALNSKSSLSKYIGAEARRAAEALRGEDQEELMRIANELNSGITSEDGAFMIRFERYLKYAPLRKEFSLAAQELENGYIRMTKRTAIGILRGIIKEEISKNLPIPIRELPREVVDYSKKVRQPQPKALPPDANLEKRYAWIDKLLATPIPDVRHRAVNLILAPYLVNVRNMNDEEASKVIISYIERCKDVDPNTKINESYIRYQCKYAKRRGRKPLSLERAKDLLGGIISIEEFEGV